MAGEALKLARCERLIAKAGCRLELGYLEALIRKPNALPGATALEQAGPAGKFTPAHKVHGGQDGTRALVEVLRGRRIPHKHLAAGPATALRAGAPTADAIALEARKAAQAEDQSPVATVYTACRILRLPPSIRNGFSDIADRAVKDQVDLPRFPRRAGLHEERR